MIGVFADQHMGQETRPWTPALNGSRGQRGLKEPFAAGACEARPDDAVHDEAAGNIFQFLGDVLADPAQAPAALGTGIGTGGQFHLHPGNVVRDRAALGFVLLLDVRELHPRRHRGCRDLAGLEGQL